MSIVLSPFTNEHAARVASWPCSADEAKSWAGNQTLYPISPAQFNGWHDDPDVRPFVGHQEGSLVAYGELWLDRDEQEIELARIIVDPKRRGIGVGRSFVQTLVDCAMTYALPSIFLRVLPNNFSAIRCYETAGFERIPLENQESFKQGQPAEYYWLEYNAGNPRV